MSYRSGEARRVRLSLGSLVLCSMTAKFILVELHTIDRLPGRCYGRGQGTGRFCLSSQPVTLCHGGAAIMTHAQTDARKLRGRLTHPIIDADGHWAEFRPQMRQEFRRIGGDTAVEALDMASARIPKSLSMSVAERRRRRIGQEAFWFLPTKN